jgi:hypothetical protein
MLTNCDKRFSIYPLLYLLCVMNGLIACTHHPVCLTANTNRTFVQLWRDDAKRSSANWDQWFLQIDHLGFEEIIVQWSSYDDISFHIDPRPGYENAPCLEAFMKTALKHQKRIWLGLDYDPSFWKAIDATPSRVKQYLSTRLSNIRQRLPHLLQSLEAIDTQGEIIQGWYISDEIDDVNWRDPVRQDLLLTYLKDLRSILHKSHQKWPVLISGFSNGVRSPDNLTKFWNTTLNHTGIDGLLFQDGIGAGKLSFEQLETYLNHLHTHLVDADQRFGVIVELFEFKQKNPNDASTLQSAQFSRVSQQIALAQQYSSLPITVFSAPDYLKPNGDQKSRMLHREWKIDRAFCR